MVNGNEDFSRSVGAVVIRTTPEIKNKSCLHVTLTERAKVALLFREDISTKVKVQKMPLFVKSLRKPELTQLSVNL